MSESADILKNVRSTKENFRSLVLASRAMDCLNAGGEKGSERFNQLNKAVLQELEKGCEVYYTKWARKERNPKSFSRVIDELHEVIFQQGLGAPVPKELAVITYARTLLSYVFADICKEVPLIDLSNKEIRSSLKGVLFCGVKLDGALFDNATLENVDFRGASLAETKFRDVTIAAGVQGIDIPEAARQYSSDGSSYTVSGAFDKQCRFVPNGVSAGAKTAHMGMPSGTVVGNGVASAIDGANVLCDYSI